jgi:carboxylate-amine ligase
MAEAFTMGIEEEFQLVDQQTGQLAPNIELILEKGNALLGDRLKAELAQSAVELVSHVCPDIAHVRDELYTQRALLAHVAQQEGMRLISAGTHPISNWQDQAITERDRYLQLLEEQQDAIRAQVIFGLHVHVGIKDRELAVRLMNQVRTWLPHLLALSTNSPFWLGRFTGIKSYRSVLWQGGPRSGIPGVLSAPEALDRYMQDLMAVGYIHSGNDIWWDVRLNMNFDTIEFRIFDMPATIEDTIALVALCQALVAKLVWLNRHHKDVAVLPRDYIMENKWQAVRYGLDAQIADFVNLRRLSMRDALHDLLFFVGDVLDDLGSHREIHHLRHLLNDPRGNGADRQISLYQQTNKVEDIIPFLTQQTLQGVLPATI